MLYYCIPTYKSFDECKQAVNTVMAGSLIPDQITIIDNSGNGAGTRALQELLIDPRIIIWPQTRNLGVAVSWNMFHTIIGRDYIIIANDDVMPHYHTVNEMFLAAKEHDDLPIIYGSGDSGNAYSLFLLRKWGFDKIGSFDERFYPAYFEDNDYAYRVHVLAGYPSYSAPNATYDHVGSSTMKKYTPAEMDAHHHAFRANALYYSSKWGDEPGRERYTTPFDGII